ncbi:KUP/HAK/KT family potassium transporter [Microbacterium sp. KR10-403]|uniref:potassium transporter Kup n=1 Tax=Microbacterium sp. KR10-403 TaxID=3158581 RepID=UPI0032E384F5
MSTARGDESTAGSDDRTAGHPDAEPADVASEERRDRPAAVPAEERARRQGAGQVALVALAVLGVVYGDLGTSTIYALHAVFNGGSAHLAPDRVDVLGILSLVFWTLILVVSVKYMTLVLRADNRGEGGVFALVALLRPWRALRRRSRRALVLVGLAGAAMLYAGVMITPAISILSAVEGLREASPHMQPFVIPVTLVIIVLLFAVQRFGTAKVGAAFGPVMAVWFVAIAALGVYGIALEPGVLAALNPAYAVTFFARNGLVGFLVLFAVFLVTTGVEALYADIGHFGRRTIRWVWFCFVLPALLLSYFGQGAALLAHPASGAQPFYNLVPRPLLYPMVVLATLATVIASQAAITGAFSMTRQASRLGMMPPFRVVQTSEQSAGQVYVPAINLVLMIAAVVLVLLFRSSEQLASTYGVSVNATMVATTVLAYVVARERGRWPRRVALPLMIVFLAIDLTYLASNLLRVPYGGWFPIVIGAALFVVMSTWRRGGELLARRTDDDALPLTDVFALLRRTRAARVRGTAVFVTPWLDDTPPSLTHQVERNGSLHRRVILLNVLVEDVPHTTGGERREVEKLRHGFVRVRLHCGYLEHVDVPAELARCEGLHVDPAAATYYIEHEYPQHGSGRLRGVAAWREHVFAFLKRNCPDPTTGYGIPADRIVDMGLRVRI